MNPVLAKYFPRPSVLEKALIHRSYCNEHPDQKSNERLEFLGDSVLSLVISDRLFRLLPAQAEGILTSRRSYFVQTASLAQKAKSLGLDQLIKLSKGEEDSGGRNNVGLLANTFEAVLGSLFLNSGISACYAFLTEIFPNPELTASDLEIKDAKSHLQEISQAKGYGTPLYTTIDSSGPDHAKTFTVSVEFGDQKFKGVGPSKQKAQNSAAKAALDSLPE